MQITLVTGDTSVSMEELKGIVETLKPLAECDNLAIGIPERVKVTSVRVEIFYDGAIRYEINFYGRNGRNPKTGKPGSIGWGRYSARQVRNLEFNDSFKE